jgi:hypothetical protein
MKSSTALVCLDIYKKAVTLIGMTTDFRNVIAEEPYDAMGAEFRETFGKWVNETTLTNPNELNQLAFGLFRLRLALAQKYNTFFAKQVTAGGKELWKDRFAGVGNEPCYSFASPEVPRTKRFYQWTLQQNRVEGEPTSHRHWDTSYAEYPSFPVKVSPFSDMKVWSHKYSPRFTARTGGSFECRRIEYGGIINRSHMFLFEHPRSRWIAQIRAEATTFWNIAWDGNNDQYTRFGALASFEWLWNWANPFMRSGALTSDALSLVMQKHIGAKTRTSFYHQDCEALLLPFDEYVEKRINDMTNGFVPRFDMNVA